jgi:hypothetical protein
MEAKDSRLTLRLRRWVRTTRILEEEKQTVEVAASEHLMMDGCGVGKNSGDQMHANRRSLLIEPDRWHQRRNGRLRCHDGSANSPPPVEFGLDNHE